MFAQSEDLKGTRILEFSDESVILYTTEDVMAVIGVAIEHGASPCDPVH
jgi:hypothetical protein